MTVCPVCQSEIEITSQHHGTLFTCPSCSGVFFVDWSGHPEAATPEASTGESSIFSDIPAMENSGSLHHHDAQFSPSPHFETPTVPTESGYSEQTFDNADENEAIASEDEAPSAYDFSQPPGQPDVLVENPGGSAALDSSDLSDIADFGNADLAQSAFNYTLTISGIDTGVIRNQIQEAISDSKFGWNVMQIMAQIKGGVLTIKSMNPVKASILMQRVKYLPVKVSWRQDVFSSTV